MCSLGCGSPRPGPQHLGSGVHLAGPGVGSGGRSGASDLTCCRWVARLAAPTGSRRLDRRQQPSLWSRFVSAPMGSAAHRFVHAVLFLQQLSNQIDFQSF